MSQDEFSTEKFETEIERLLAIMARLRDPVSGCSWDLEQSFQTIAPYTIEEAYEVADAIERKDYEDLKDELGDLLLQVVFHSQLAQDQNLFNFSDVAKSISDKMVRRHPHVFSDLRYETSEEQSQAWEKIKQEERLLKGKASNQGDESILDHMTRGLPSLTFALKIQERVVDVGFEWPNVNGVIDKIHEELNEVKEEFDRETRQQDAIEEEIGDLLFTVVNLARWAKVDADTALRKCNVKFEKRFRLMENILSQRGLRLDKVTLEDMESGWIAAKNIEKSL